MNLKLGICWIEDQPSEAEREAVEEKVRECGFEPEVMLIKSEAEVSQCAERQRHFQEYELILLDLKLGAGLQGDELAVKIRQSFRSTPILFYSGKPVDELRERMSNKGIEGVYCTSRPDLADRVGELVSDLSPRLNRLSGMRGLAAQTVAECDQEFRHILLHVAKKGRADEQKIVQSLKSRIEKLNIQQSSRLEEVDTIDRILHDRAASSALLFQEVMRCLRSFKSDDVRELRKTLSDYQAKVIEQRNLLAHELEVETPTGWQIARGKAGEGQPQVTVDKFSDIRSDFLIHLRNVRSLRELLVDKEAN